MLTCLSVLGCCLQSFGGPLACFGRVYAKTFDGGGADRFGHVCFFANDLESS